MNMNKIPDKIYIHRTIHLGLLSASEIDITGQDEQYIHKNALLEWLRKEYETISWYHEKMKHVTGHVGDTDSSGKAEVYKKVIDKLNSM